LEERRILIVDDENIILDILQEHLSERGFDCVVAGTPREALDALREAESSILLTDIVMPEMSGIDLAQAARNLWPDLGVIVMTGKTDVTTAISALRAGADDYVVKPFDFEEMLICVDRALEKRRLVRENRQHSEQLEVRVKEATHDLAKANELLSQTETYLNNLINSTVDGIITIDHDDLIGFANRGAQHMFGYTAKDLLQRPIADLYIGGAEEA